MALGGTFEPALIRSRGLAALLHKLTIGLRALGTAVIGAASELGQVMPPLLLGFGCRPRAFRS